MPDRLSMNAGPVSLEALTPAQILQQQDALYALFETIYASTDFMADEFAERYPSAAALGATLAAAQQRTGAVFMSAGDAAGLAGFVAIEPRPAARLRHTAELHMGLAPAARGLGLGQRLLEAALAELRAARQIELLYLMVRADNTAAVSLYARCGFEILARLPRDTRIGECHYDGLLMRLALAPAPAPAQTL